MNPQIESLPILVLDVYSRCNCRCTMCDIWKRDTAHQLSIESLRRQLPAIERLGVKWIVLTGGEPLMHPRLLEIGERLKQREIRITLLTTGLLLHRFADQVIRFVDDVIVSLDGPPDIHDRIRRVPGAFERLREGIAALRLRQPKFPISARCTVQRENCTALAATVEFARALGLDSISFLAADTHSSAFNHTTGNFERILPDIARLNAEIERLILSGDCGAFIAETPAKLRRIVDHARWSFGIGEPVAPPCNAPWVSAVWDAEGAVRPCFFHPPIGRVTEEKHLDGVLNSPQAIAFRSLLNVAENPICRRCVCSLHWKA